MVSFGVLLGLALSGVSALLAGDGLAVPGFDDEVLATLLLAAGVLTSLVALAVHWLDRPVPDDLVLRDRLLGRG